jgi:hypothetical protein
MTSYNKKMDNLLTKKQNKIYKINLKFQRIKFRNQI